MIAALNEKSSDLNPQTFSEAEALLRHVESLCMPWNVDAMAEGFTEDCIARFGLLPEMHGREAIREFFLKRSMRQKNYKLRKSLRAMMGSTLAMDWTGTWEDAETGVAMQGHGVEIWQLRAGKLAVWEAAFNISKKNSSDNLAIV